MLTVTYVLVYIILSVFGLLAGIGASMFGFGGGFVIVPLLYRLLGSSGPSTMHIAIATSTSVMVISAFYASFRHHKRGNIGWHMIFPLAIYIAIGAGLGVYFSSHMDNTVLRWLFIAYLVYTIADCLLRKTFLGQSEKNGQLDRISGTGEFSLGLLIGAIATLLGVGGSVMTVPLLRRLGATMNSAVAMVNPLSFPVALVGVVGYSSVAYQQHVNLGNGYLGFVYLPAFAILTAGALIGVRLGTNMVHKIPDRAHAHVYIALLCLVLVTMIVK